MFYRQLLISFIILLCTWLTSYAAPLLNNVGLLVLAGVWTFLLGNALFVIKKRRRSLWLIYAAESSFIKRRFAGGVAMFSLQCVKAALLTIPFLLMLSKGLLAEQWLLVGAAFALWLVLYPLLSRFSKRHVALVAQADAAAWLSFILVAIVFISAWLVHSLYMVEQPCLDALTLPQAFSYGQQQASTYDSVWLTRSLGYWEGLHHAKLWLLLEAMSYPLPYLLIIAAWFIAGVQAAVFIFPLLAMLRGATLSLTRRGKNATKFSGALVLVIIATGLYGMYLRPPTPQHIGKETYCITFDDSDSCYAVTQQELDDALKKAIEKLQPEQQKAFNLLSLHATQELDKLFSLADNNIDTFIDWHYSFGGALTRGAALVSKESKKTIENKFDRLIFGEQGMQGAIDTLNDTLLAEYSELQTLLNHQFVSTMKELLNHRKAHPHNQAVTVNAQQSYLELVAQQLDSQQALVEFSVATGAGIGAAALVTRQAAKHQAAKTGAKVAGRRAIPAAASSLCIATGPAVVACGAAVFTVTTLAVEASLLKADEFLNADDKKRVIQENLAEEKQRLLTTYHEQLLRIFPQHLDELKALVKGKAATARAVVEQGTCG